MECDAIRKRFPLIGWWHSTLLSFHLLHRYSGDFTDSGQSKSAIGQNNNGYVPNITDYSPQSHTALLLRNGNSNISETNFHPNGQVPSVNSTLSRNTAGSRTTNVDSRQDNGLPNVHGSFNSLQNSLISEWQPTWTRNQKHNDARVLIWILHLFFFF